MAKGLVVILSGVSSIGKDQVRQKLLDDPELGLMDIISLTTRPKKETEDVYKRQDSSILSHDGRQHANGRADDRIIHVGRLR